MKAAAIYTSENCPGVPKGAVVRVHTDKLEADQHAAWAYARKVHERIYWEARMKEMSAATAAATPGRV